MKRMKIISGYEFLNLFIMLHSAECWLFIIFKKIWQKVLFWKSDKDRENKSASKQYNTHS